jgi:uncharacterized integral membrane protein
LKVRFRTAVTCVILLAIAAFLILNWKVFAAPASFYFVLGSVDLPMGVVMLGLLGLVVLVSAITVGVWQAGVLRDYRRQSQELQTQRTLADDAEASRFTALTTLLREELARQDARSSRYAANYAIRSTLSPQRSRKWTTGWSVAGYRRRNLRRPKPRSLAG